MKHKHINNCTKEQFECLYSKKCIDNQLLCDNHIDCIDASDELFCTSSTSVINSSINL